jgi:hypothetical protein
MNSQIPRAIQQSFKRSITHVQDFFGEFRGDWRRFQQRAYATMELSGDGSDFGGQGDI